MVNIRKRKPYFVRSETFCREISVEALFYSSFGFNKGGLKAQWST